MEWIINQLRVHPELAIFLTLFAGFWLALGHVATAAALAVTIVGLPFAWQHIKLAELVFPWIKKGWAATGGIRCTDVYCQPGGTMDTRQNHGIPCRGSCRTFGRLTDHIRRDRRGKRYNQPIGNQRCAKSDIHQCDSGSLRCNLYLRYSRFCMDSGFSRP